MLHSTIVIAIEHDGPEILKFDFIREPVKPETINMKLLFGNYEINTHIDYGYFNYIDIYINSKAMDKLLDILVKIVVEFTMKMIGHPESPIQATRILNILLHCIHKVIIINTFEDVVR